VQISGNPLKGVIILQVLLQRQTFFIGKKVCHDILRFRRQPDEDTAQ
jgi:hypothetical protein